MAFRAANLFRRCNTAQQSFSCVHQQYVGRSWLRKSHSLSSYRPFSTEVEASELRAADIIRIGGKNNVNYTVPPTTSLYDALQTMKSQRIGAVVAVDGDEVLGLLTERDIMWNVTLENDWAHIPVSQIMTPLEKLITVAGDETPAECLEIMTFKKFRHLPVVRNDTKSLLGILSMKDVILATNSVSGAKSAFLGSILPHQAPGGLRAWSKNSQFLSLVSGAHSIPHPAKAKTGGEDAHFVHDGKIFSAIGVADGVGSNSFEHGIDAALFPRGLMSSQTDLLNAHDWSQRPPDPVGMLKHAWNHVVTENTVGSSTICIVSLKGGSQRLHAVNVGDSGFLVLRDVSKDRRNLGTMFRRSVGRQACIVFRSTQQLHDFNWPVQIGRALDGDTSHFDTIQQAEVIDTDVQEGDIVVLATDGLFDNVSEDEIINLVDFDETDVNEIAQRLAQRAFDLSLDRMTDSPFAILAKDHNIMWGGGRPDDITVVVARVSADEDAI